jgi:hypothetical protein
MADPALKRSLSPSDIEELTRGTQFELVRRRTPGLTELTGGDKLLIWGVVLVISGMLHLNAIYSFLPFSFSPSINRFISMVFYLTIGVGLLMVFGIVLGIVIGVGASLKDRLFPRQPYINCPRCATRNKVKKYVEGQSCSECGSRLVYCAKCGKSSDIAVFISGSGCGHCGNEEMSVSW